MCSRPNGTLHPRSFIDANTNARLTHAQVRDAAAVLSTALVRRHGLRPGDVVSICAPNSIVYPICTHAAIRAGAIPALSSPAYNEEEMVHALSTVGSRFVVCSREALPVVRAAGRRLGIEEDKVFVIGEEEMDEVDGAVTVRRLLREGRELKTVDVVGLPEGKTSGQVPAVLCFSSGTTGLPKAVSFQVKECTGRVLTKQVMISHQNLMAQVLQLIPTTAPDHHTVLGVLPLYHGKNSLYRIPKCDQD